MVIRMRHTRAHTANRRSHHALKSPRLSKCSECSAMKKSHEVCFSCGKYNGRVVIDLAGKRAKAEKKEKAKAAK